MEITKEKMVSMLHKMWQLGYLQEPKNIVAFLNENGFFEKDDTEPPVITANHEFKVYTIAELMEFPVGTIFIHEDCGKGIIESEDNIRYMVFEDKQFNKAAMRKDDYPFNVPMKFVG